jgi:hypothetical protein
MTDKHFVVQGAMCKCSFGNSSAKLMASGNGEYINDHSASIKAVASNKETGNPFLPGAFGYCSFSRSPCIPAIVEWKDFVPGITLSNGGKILTEESTAICAVSGSCCISIIQHGQTTTVSSAHARQGEKATGKGNLVLPTQASHKKIPRIQAIGLSLEKRTPAVTFNSTLEKNDAIIVRINEPLSFYVESYRNNTCPDETMVSWKVFNNHNFSNTLFSFERTGPHLQINFEAGNYRVMAYGEEQDNTAVYLDIVTMNNRLKNEFSFSSTGNSKIGQLRKGLPVIINASYGSGKAICVRRGNR